MQNGTCQCTLCRKFTGALLPQSFTVPTESITPSFKSQDTYKQFKSSEKAARGFCSTCGSSLTFNYLAKSGETEIYLGTVDEDILLGPKDGEETHGEQGKKTARGAGALGPVLARTDRSGHIWYENAIESVTDQLPGAKWWRDSSDGKPFNGPAEAEEKGDADAPPTGMGIA